MTEEEKSERSGEVDENLNRFELVLLCAKRAREINKKKTLKEKNLDKSLIPERKITSIALDEINAGELMYKYPTPDEKKKAEQKEKLRSRGLKKIY